MSSQPSRFFFTNTPMRLSLLILFDDCRYPGLLSLPYNSHALGPYVTSSILQPLGFSTTIIPSPTDHPQPCVSDPEGPSSILVFLRVGDEREEGFVSPFFMGPKMRKV